MEAKDVLLGPGRSGAEYTEESIDDIPLVSDVEFRTKPTDDHEGREPGDSVLDHHDGHFSSYGSRSCRNGDSPICHPRSPELEHQDHTRETSQCARCM